MGDIVALSQFFHAQNLRPIVDTSAPILAPIAEQSSSSGPDVRADTRGFTGHANRSFFENQPNQDSPDATPTFEMKKPIDHDVIPGPSPTFQVSILEMDADLEQTIARLNAEQTFGKSDKLGAAESEDLSASDSLDLPDTDPSEMVQDSNAQIDPNVEPSDASNTVTIATPEFAASTPSETVATAES